MFIVYVFKFFDLDIFNSFRVYYYIHVLHMGRSTVDHVRRFSLQQGCQ